MTAVWLRFRVELRSSWRAWLTLAVLAGLAGGVLVAVAAGARRTDSALPRYVAAYRFRDATVYGSHYALQHAATTLPHVSAWSIGVEEGFSARDAQGNAVFGVGAHAVLVYASTDGREGNVLDRWKLLAGRKPDQDRPWEAMLDSRAARTFGVGPGDRMRLKVEGQAVHLRVVGITAANDPVDHPGGIVYLTRAFGNLYSGYSDLLYVRLKHGARDLPAFQRGIDGLVGGGAVDQRTGLRDVQSSIHSLVQALWLAVALGALFSTLLLGHALARLAGSGSLQFPTLRAVGMTQRQLAAIGVARAATIALGAGALAVCTAIALSPFAPLGYARELEPHPGFVIDSGAVGLGGAVVFATVLLAGAFAAWRAAEPRSGAAPAGLARIRAADALARWGLPAPVVTGVRLALARGRSRGGPVGSALVGVTLAVVVVGTALTFSASLHHLLSTPRLIGENWDYRIEGIGDPSAQPAWKSFERKRRLSAVAIGTDMAFVEVDGRQVGLAAMKQLRGSLLPTVIQGHAPRRHHNHEIALGTKTMRALGLRLGDTVEVQGLVVQNARPERMRIVGRVVLPDGYPLHNALGEGAVTTWQAAVNIGAVDPAPNVLQLRFAPGPSRSQDLAWLTKQRLPSGGTEPTFMGIPAPAADFGGVSQLPAAISALLVALAVIALAQTLVVAVRRRRRDLAILKTLGFDRRQLLATVGWQATTFAAVGLLIGLPLGDALGRWAWNLFADQLGVVPEAVTPVPLLLLIVPGAIVLANLVAIVPAGIAARTRPALVLRAE